MRVKVMSFGFKHGVPPDVNYVWDIRFLPNPYWVDELKEKTGLNSDVSDYVIGSSAGHDFIKLLKPMLFYIIKQNSNSDKEDLTIGIGCTGGKHRSVAVTEVISDMLTMLPVDLTIEHRDIEKE